MTLEVRTAGVLYWHKDVVLLVLVNLGLYFEIVEALAQERDMNKFGKSWRGMSEFGSRRINLEKVL